MTLAIEAQGLRKSFGAFDAVRGVDLSIRHGDVFALLGPNGAGKTTTINMLTTLLRPDAGTVRVCGYDVALHPDEVRRRISVTGQFAALDEALTGLQNLTLFAGLYGYSRKEVRTLAAELLDSFGLADAAGRTVGAYSGGMRRRLDLAAGILSRPEVLFLDEPTTGLDPQSRHDLWATVRRLAKEGTTVLLTTQYLEEADQLADRIGFIAEGQIIAVGTASQLKAATGGQTLTVRLTSDADTASICRLLADEHGLAGQTEDDGRMVRFTVQQAASAHSAVGTLLRHAPAAVDSFAVGEPSLDDVYFALTTNRDKAAAS